MIRGALLHLPGLGPNGVRQLRLAGIDDWTTLRRYPGLRNMAAQQRAKLILSIDACEKALCDDDVAYLIKTFKPCDRWRILNHYFSRASYFDLETTGLGAESDITLIGLWHRDRFHAFVRGRNLDGFLDILDEIDLLISFNGASFDVPRVTERFRIPDLPCAHLDLRWLCYREHLKGGLKIIERQLGIQRPAELCGVDGDMATWLWHKWERENSEDALKRLIAYCRADVTALKTIAAQLLARKQDRIAEAPSPAPTVSLEPSSTAPLPQPFVDPNDENEALYHKMKRFRGKKARS